MYWMMDKVTNAGNRGLNFPDEWLKIPEIPLFGGFYGTFSIKRGAILTCTLIFTVRSWPLDSGKNDLQRQAFNVCVPVSGVGRKTMADLHRCRLD